MRLAGLAPPTRLTAFLVGTAVGAFITLGLMLGGALFAASAGLAS